jgi:long-chain fatty acid transport protein
MSHLWAIRASVLIIPSVFALVITTPSSAPASGFAIYTQGAKELAMMGATVAHTEGPASCFFNPALLTQLPGTKLEIGTTIIKPDREFKSDLTGKTTETESTTHFPSTLYFTHQLDERLFVGLGIGSTFGLGTEWPEDWEGRYITTEVELLTLNFNPNVAWKVNDKLSLSFGVNYLYGDATLKQNINLMPFGLPDAKQEFDGDGDGWGFNLGLHYQILENLSFGMSFRSDITLELDGDVKFKLPAGAPPVLGALFPNTSGYSDIELPEQLFAGISYAPRDHILIELTGRWEGWSNYEKLQFNFDDPIAGDNVITLERDWDDVYGIMVGVKYLISPTLALSAGYLHDENPVPDHTYEPTVSAADKDDFSIGIQKVFNQFNFAFTYVYEKYDDRKKNNSVGAESGFPANGTYKQEAHMFALSVLYDF